MKTKNQLDTLKEIIKTNKEKYTLQEIIEIFAECFDKYETNSKVVQSIKSKIEIGEWNSLVNGITMSFFMSLHASHMPLEEIIKLAQTEGVMGIEIIKKKD